MQELLTVLLSVDFKKSSRFYKKGVFLFKIVLLKKWIPQCPNKGFKIADSL